MGLIFSVFVYWVALLYALTVGVNFVIPITGGVAAAILLISSVGAWLAGRCAPIGRMKKTPDDRRGNIWFKWMTLAGFLILGAAVSSRPCIGIDANMYHLPLSILTNQSVWYPGIANLSDAYGILHANSILSSVFTAWGWPGSENIINFVTWCMFLSMLWRIFQVWKWPRWLMMAAAGMFLFQYNLLSAAFNMGNDLGQGFFMFCALLLLFKEKHADALLCMSLAALFRITGQAGYGLIFLFLVLSDRKSLFSGKAIFSYLLIVLSLARTFIGTGMLVYPMPIPFFPVPEWGAPIDYVAEMGRTMMQVQPQVDYSLTGLLDFIFRYFVIPKTVRSPWWYGPVVIFALMVCGLQWRVVLQRLRLWKRDQWIALVCVGGILLFWLISKPQFRYAAGAWLFVTLGLIKLAFDIGGVWMRRTLSALILGSGIMFTAHETARYSQIFYEQWRMGTQDPTASLVVSSERVGYRKYEDIIKIMRTSEGRQYTWTDGPLIGRWPQPAIGERAMRDTEELIREFYRYNPDCRPDFETMPVRDGGKAAIE